MRRIALLVLLTVVCLAGCRQKVWTPLHEGRLESVDINMGAWNSPDLVLIKFEDNYQRMVNLRFFDNRSWTVGRQYRLETNRCAGDTYFRLVPTEGPEASR